MKLSLKVFNAEIIRRQYKYNMKFKFLAVVTNTTSNQEFRFRILTSKRYVSNAITSLRECTKLHVKPGKG